METMALFTTLGPTEVLIILMVGLLLFGRRLPEVGRSLGKGIVEFKRGLKGIEDDIDQESSRPAITSSPARPPLTSQGEDARVSRAEEVEQPTPEPARTEPPTPGQ